MATDERCSWCGIGTGSRVTGPGALVCGTCLESCRVLPVAPQPHGDACMADRWEQERYVRKMLRPFAVEQLARLRTMHRAFGPGSALAGHGRYLLAGQPEALAVCERLTARPMLLGGLWKDELPEVLLSDVAEAWGVRSPVGR